MNRPTRYLGVVVATAILAACSPGSEEGGESTTSTSIVTSTTTTGDSTTSTGAATTTSGPTTTVPATTTTFPGEPVEGGPPADATLMVIGVEHDDVLNLRALPGATQEILAGIPPTYDALTALGQTRMLPAWWTEVDFEGTWGWVNMSYLAYEGATDDITASVLDRAGGSIDAPTMTLLGAEVAELLASEDPPSNVVLVVAETIGDLGEVTYDVVGLGDDSVRGLRVHVFGTPVAGGFTLKSVESTTLCQPNRGVDPDGVCA